MSNRVWLPHDLFNWFLNFKMPAHLCINKGRGTLKLTKKCLSILNLSKFWILWTQTTGRRKTNKRWNNSRFVLLQNEKKKCLKFRFQIAIKVLNLTKSKMNQWKYWFSKRNIRMFSLVFLILWLELEVSNSVKVWWTFWI